MVLWERRIHLKTILRERLIVNWIWRSHYVVHTKNYNDDILDI